MQFLQRIITLRNLLAGTLLFILGDLITGLF